MKKKGGQKGLRSESADEGRTFWGTYGIYLVLCPLIIICFVLIIPRVASLINSLVIYGSGRGATTVFVVLVSLMTLSAGVPLPGFIFVVFAAGILYGVLYGFLLAYSVSFVASCSWFLLYRNCCGKAIVKYFGTLSERTNLWLELAEKDGIRVVFLVKMLPFGGGGTANVFFAVMTKVSLSDFAAGLSIAHLKYLLFTFVSASAGSLATLKNPPNAQPSNSLYKQRSHTMHLVMGGVGVLVLLVLAWWTWKTYNEIEEQLKDAKRKREPVDGDSTKETDRLLGASV